METRASGSPGQPSGGPSECLEHILRNEISGVRLRRTSDAFLQHYTDTAGKETVESAEACCKVAARWYGKILLSHVREERNRRGEKGVSVILGNDLFHCCLVACSLYIATVAKSFPCDLPTLLAIIGLHPYHFWKVIEPVLRAVEDLPPHVFTHLSQAETRIAESLAWAKDSPLWEELTTNGGHLPPCVQVVRSSWLEQPKENDAHPDVNTALADHSYSVQQYISSFINRPRKKSKPQRFVPKMMRSSQLEEPKTNDMHPELNIVLVDHCYSVLQYSSSVISTLPRSNGLQLFARKVYILMGNRLHKLCKMLDISDELRLKIWTCFVHSLVHCADLVVDRHLDQLLLCAIQIIAALYNPSITFKDIISCYCSQPMANENVCQSVLISREDGGNQSPTGDSLTPSTPSPRPPGKESRGSLRDFYTRVYATKMEAFAKQFEPLPGVESPPLSPYPQRWKSASRKRLHGTNTVYISPYTADTPTPRSPLVSYTLNSSPRECLKEINQMFKRCMNPEEEGEDGPSAKLFCQGPHFMKLVRGVENDRRRSTNQS